MALKQHAREHSGTHLLPLISSGAASSASSLPLHAILSHAPMLSIGWAACNLLLTHSGRKHPHAPGHPPHNVCLRMLSSRAPRCDSISSATQLLTSSCLSSMASSSRGSTSATTRPVYPAQLPHDSLLPTLCAYASHATHAHSSRRWLARCSRCSMAAPCTATRGRHRRGSVARVHVCKSLSSRAAATPHCGG